MARVSENNSIPTNSQLENALKLLKVVHLVPAPFGSDGVFGGAERYALELAKNMATKTPTRLVSFGNCYRNSIYPEGLAEFVLGKSIHVRGQRTNPFHSGMFKHFWWADVIHCHQNHTLIAELAAIFCRLAGKRVFASDLGGGGWGFNSYINTDKTFHGHLHISEYSKINSGHAKYPKATVIYGGVDTSRFKPNSNVQKEPLVVFVGRIMPHKGINYLIESLPEGLELEVIGKQYNSEYQNHLNHLVGNKRVRFQPECLDEEVIKAYQRARCVVLPSVYQDYLGNETKVPELLGQTLLEGMACGIPGLTTRVASLPEIVEDGISGWIVEPNSPEQIRSILENIRDKPQLVARMGESARIRIHDKFTWDKTVERCLCEYSKNYNI